MKNDKFCLVRHKIKFKRSWKTCLNKKVKKVEEIMVAVVFLLSKKIKDYLAYKTNNSQKKPNLRSVSFSKNWKGS